MARAAEPTVTSDQIVFELERFERSDGQLTLTGRWFGVRGRRFVRPTLTLALEGERTRALADLDDKPWPAEDGEPWRASFPWARSGRVQEPELSVAPDITIQLPAPGARRGRPQRLAAQPRHEVMSASYGAYAAPTETLAIDQEPETPGPDALELERPTPELESRPPEPALPDPEPDPVAMRAELDRLQVQLAEAENAAETTSAERESLRAELSALRAELADARRTVGSRDGALEALQAELSATRAAREAALKNAAQAEAEREGALTRAGQAEAERDALVTEKSRLNAALEVSRSTAEQLTREHEEAVASRGAALVMRGATRALPAYDHHVGWIRRGLAILVLIGIVFAVLIVLGTL